VTERIRVGTRRSRLAQSQTGSVLSLLRRATPVFRFDPVPIDTSGDRNLSPGGSPDFTDAIDRALLRGEIDLAVHSAKDLPVELDRRLEIVAYPRRADPRDCLVVARHLRPTRVPRGSHIGSSSLRRQAQLLRWRPDLTIVEIRGNVDTRIELVRSGKIDAAILAVAGLSRLGRTPEVGRVLPVTRFLPAPGQGALAVVARSGDKLLKRTVQPIDRPGTRACVTAERTFAAALGGDCRVPLGALATVQDRSLSLVGEVLSPNGRSFLRSRRTGSVGSAERLGSKLGQHLLEQGAAQLWSSARG
jgi:hydroxymethylbilane synthase